MYFQDAIKVLLRRWYVVLVGFGLVLGASVAAIVLVPTDYQATGQVLLLLPADATGVASPTNPYLNLQPGLTVAASLIAGDLTTKETQRDMVASGFPSDYTIALNPGTGPLLVVTAEDNRPDAAVATRDEVIRRIGTELALIQRDESVPVAQVMYARSDSTGTQAEVLPGSKIRAIAIIAAVGLVLTVLVAFVYDRAAEARSAARYRRGLAIDENGGTANDTSDGVSGFAARSTSSAKSSGSPTKSPGSTSTAGPPSQRASLRLGVRNPAREGEVAGERAR